MRPGTRPTPGQSRIYSIFDVDRPIRCSEYGKRRTQMKDSTKNQVQGRVNEVKGKIKEKVGKVTNDPNLQAEGQDEKLGGKRQKSGVWRGFMAISPIFTTT